MGFQELRRAVQGEIFDYQMVMHHLQEYKKPRDALSRLLKSQWIIRIKKGLYVFGADFRRLPLSKEILANLIYSPSYISLEYALSTFGLIPERAYAVTSICLNRSKSFTTPEGVFVYKKRSPSVYPLGLTHIEVPQEGGYVMATPEKALVDRLHEEKSIYSLEEMRNFLFESMRMEKDELQKLNKKLLKEILEGYRMDPLLLKAIYD